MFRHSTEIEKLFLRLDKRLMEPLEAFVIGGANLLAQNIIQRETNDIDVVSPPTFSENVIEAIQTIAKEEGIDKKWLNTMPSLDERFLSKGWKERSSLYFEGKNLRVLLVHRKDILGMKIAAAFDRAKRDQADILDMNPTEEEWEFGREWARNYDGNPDWPRMIDQLVEQIKELQKKRYG